MRDPGSAAWLPANARGAARERQIAPPPSLAGEGWDGRQDADRSLPAPVARSLALDRPTLLLAHEPAFFRRSGRLGGDPFLRRMQRGAKEFGQAFARILAVARLVAEALRLDHQHACVGEPAVTARQHARAHVFRQRWRMRDIETQLHRALGAVDVLPARTARAQEALGQFGIGDIDVWRDAHA